MFSVRHKLSCVAAALVGTIALAVIAGWLFQIAGLVQLAPGWAPMQLNTALCFLLCAAALALLDAGKTRLAVACAGVVCAVGVVTLCQYRFGFNCGLDTCIVKHPFILFATSHPGRMSPLTAVTIILNGAALLLAARSTTVTRALPVAGLLALAAGAVGAISVFGYLSGIETIYGYRGFTYMALHSALCTVLLSGGVWASLLRNGVRKYNGARWFLLPTSIFVIGLAGTISHHLLNEWDGAVAWHKHTYDVLLKLDALQIQLSNLKRADLSDPAASLPAENGSESDFTRLLTELSTLTADNPVQVDALRRIRPASPKLLAWYREQARQRREQNGGAPDTKVPLSRGAQLLSQVQAEVAGMRIEESRLLNAREATARRLARDASIIVICSSALAITLVLAACLWLLRALSERQRSEARLVLSEENLRLMLESVQRSQMLLRMAGRLSRMGAWSVEVPTFKQTWSDEVCAIHGTPPGFSPTVENAINFYAPEFREMVTRGFGDCVRDGTPFDLEMQLITAQGQRIWVRSIGEAERSATGAIQRVQGAFQDITERKAAEEEIRKLNAQLEQRVKDRTAQLSAANTSLTSEIAERKQGEIELVKAFHAADEANQAKSSFLARMSHEIRTPMNGIIGITYLLKQTSMTLRQGDYARKIDVSAQNLMGIINDILDFSKIEAGKMELEDLAFNLEDVLARLSELAGGLAHRKSLECKISIGARTPMLLIGDALRLGQVLTNLATNAIKFTERGEVEVAVAPVESSETHVLLRFKIRDTGIGIGAVQIAKLFEPFAQSDTSTSRRFGGTGLGLVIAKRFVKMMGGEISVQSEAGQGSTFSFTARFRLDPKFNIGNGSGQFVKPRRKALVVNGDAASSLQLLALLTELSFDAVCTDSCAGAVQELARLSAEGLQRYDVVLMDCSLPNAIFMEDANRIRRDCGGISLPPFVLVASPEGSDLTLQMENLGFDGFVLRPLTRSSLFDATQRALAKESRVQIEVLNAKVSSALKDSRILVVEDNEINRQVALELLRVAGCEVVLAQDGQDALDIIDGLAPDEEFAAVLMDIQMPGLDGYSTTHRIRAGKRFAAMPIIAMTADAVAGVKERCLAAGMNAYLTKPIDPDALYATLKEWIMARAPSAATDLVSMTILDAGLASVAFAPRAGAAISFSAPEE